MVIRSRVDAAVALECQQLSKNAGVLQRFSEGTVVLNVDVDAQLPVHVQQPAHELFVAALTRQAEDCLVTSMHIRSAVPGRCQQMPNHTLVKHRSVRKQVIVRHQTSAPFRPLWLKQNLNNVKLLTAQGLVQSLTERARLDGH